MAIGEDRFEFFPIADMTDPPNGLIQHFKDCWWIAHPEKGLAFFKSAGRHLSPQCNINESITRKLAVAYPWCEVVFIPSAFRRINPNDYA